MDVVRLVRATPAKRGDQGCWPAAPEPLDYATEQDLAVGRARQAALNAAANRRGETWAPLVVDGLVGARSLARAKQLGYGRWREVA